MTIELIDVYKSYGPTDALRGINLSIATASVVGLVGLNGSGKTTTLKLISGLLNPTRGRILIDGTPPSQAKGDLAFHGELDTTYPWLNPKTGERFMAGLYPGFDCDRYRQLLDQLEVPNQRNDEMSKGQKSRFKLAMTLARRTKLYLLDEPLSGIDPISRKKIMEALVNESKGHATLVISTHEIEIAQQLFDRIVVVSKGRVVLDKSAEALRAGGDNIVDVFERAIQ